MYRTYGVTAALVLAPLIAGGVWLVRSQGTALGGSGQLAAADARPAPTIVQAGTVAPPPPGSTLALAEGTTPVSARAIAVHAPPPAGYVEYRDDAYGFSLYYEPGARVTRYAEGGGAETVSVEDFSDTHGLQVFIVPYAEPKISEARFKEDVPAGVRTNVEKTSLDGVEAVTFTSQDATLGATREVWSIHNGYLYEITTFAGVGAWFTPIIQSWRWH